VIERNEWRSPVAVVLVGVEAVLPRFGV
jgi:hypothetical protein